MKIKSQKDFLSGLMFTCVGLAFALGATNYTIGSGARMGPGYFPLLLGTMLAIGGGVVMLGALTAGSGAPGGDPVGRIAWKPLALIIGSNLVFGVLLGGLPSIGVPAMGLLVAIYALVVVSSLAGTRFSLKSALILGTILAIGSYLTFIIGLSLQFQVWPTFITG
ncbi:tripartite tricarboxylate transporter TctB family protein [Variovorax ginsengisoli]|uniref:Tripartite tricarboxylate transporter TctB family protein n=1 Tax=Variovorax ginsengisoli TaxID=363844 RepID=A0ABT8SCH5_9BURK|nr:tripartite tricarboxylate transporter TctB family protein [Variovorax ginsengisoli]MDN8617456.1 tripartite tricarboxylate transporter TctB family protein [Variovorax ginsengisoli]MDO1536626.1 tripartite tricarboxylate transporter TctB family protein [Variovorax ginsengisoli]